MVATQITNEGREIFSDGRHWELKTPAPTIRAADTKKNGPSG